MPDIPKSVQRAVDEIREYHGDNPPSNKWIAVEEAARDMFGALKIARAMGTEIFGVEGAKPQDVIELAKWILVNAPVDPSL